MALCTLKNIFKNLRVPKVLFWGKTFYRSSMDRRSFSGLLWTEVALHIFYGQTIFFGSSVGKRLEQVVHGSKSFLRSFMDWRRLTVYVYRQKTFYGSSMNRWLFYRSSMDHRTWTGFLWKEVFFSGLLWTDDLLQAFHASKTFYKSSIDLLQVSHGAKPFSGLLQTEYLEQVNG